MRSHWSSDPAYSAPWEEQFSGYWVITEMKAAMSASRCLVPGNLQGYGFLLAVTTKKLRRCPAALAPRTASHLQCLRADPDVWINSAFLRSRFRVKIKLSGKTCLFTVIYSSSHQMSVTRPGVMSTSHGWARGFTKGELTVLELHTWGNEYSERAYDGLSHGEAGVINAQVNFASVMEKKGAH